LFMCLLAYPILYSSFFSSKSPAQTI
jgi:hypothetical protein